MLGPENPTGRNEDLDQSEELISDPQKAVGEVIAWYEDFTREFERVKNYSGREGEETDEELRSVAIIPFREEWDEAVDDGIKSEVLRLLKEQGREDVISDLPK